MTEGRFWEWVDVIRESADVDAEAKKRIREMSALDVAWVEYWQWVMNARQLARPLFSFLEMAFDGSFGNSSFLDFRPWLVYQGEKICKGAVRDPDSLVPLLRGKERWEILCGEGPYETVVLFADSVRDQINNLDPELLPPDMAWPKLSGDAIYEENWQQHFPIGYREYVVEGKVIE